MCFQMATAMTDLYQHQQQSSTGINQVIIQRENIVDKIWDRQEKFEQRFFEFKNIDFHNMTSEQKRFWTKEFYGHIVVELSQMLEKMQYKMHRNYSSDINEFNVKDNLIDAYKLLLGLLQIWFKDYNEFNKIFNDKSDIVDMRFQFEKINNITGLQGPDNIIIVDIDGVLADLETSMYNFIVNAYKKIYLYQLNEDQLSDIEKYLLSVKQQINYDNFVLNTTTRDIKKLYPEIYEHCKHLYRCSKNHRNLNKIENALKFTKQLKKLGYTIIIITARPYENYNNLWSDTMYWLNNNNIIYDALYFDNKKHEKILELFGKDHIYRIKGIIDDNINICNDFEKLGIKSFCIDHRNITFHKIIENLKKEFHFVK